MNPSQLKAYRAEVAKWRAACAKLGRACDEDARRALHASCNAPASSTAFTNAQFTRVLAKLRSVSDPGNFAAQMHAQEEPEMVRADYFERITAAFRILLPDHECRCQKGYEDHSRRNYCARIVRDKWSVADVSAMDTDTLRKFTFAMEARANTRKKRDEAQAQQAAIAQGESADRRSEWDPSEPVEF